MRSLSPGVVHRWCDEHADELIAVRRHLHAHPELSWCEHATTELIAERLSAAGLAPTVLPGGTGAICDVGGGDDDTPTVALRADIDALAMDDLTDGPHRSRVPGVAHACGHDVHTTVGLGVASLLAEAPSLPGRVRLLFQPAEEVVPGGATFVIDHGGLDGVDAVLGLHCDPRLDVGRVGLRAGPITSAADAVEIELRGPGGHTARPEDTVDLVAVLARLALDLPDATAGSVGERGPIKMVVGHIAAGDAANVIPTHGRLRLSLRTPSTDAWDRLGTDVTEAVDTLLEGTGVTHRLVHTKGVPPVVNDAQVVEVVRTAATSWLDPGAVTEAVQSWGGDDVSWYLRQVPGCYVRLGTHDPAVPEPRRDLHSGDFDVDERAIGVGIRLLAGATLRLLTDRRDGCDGEAAPSGGATPSS